MCLLSIHLGLVSFLSVILSGFQLTALPPPSLNYAYVFYIFGCCCKWNCFIHYLFRLFVVGIWNHKRFLGVDLVSYNFADFICCSRSFSLSSLGFSEYRVMSLVNRSSFTSSSPIWTHFISFYCRPALIRTSSTMLCSRSESGHPCLVLYIKRKTCSLSLLSVMLVTVNALYPVEKVTFHYQFSQWDFFFFLTRAGC